MEMWEMLARKNHVTICRYSNYRYTDTKDTGSPKPRWAGAARRGGDAGPPAALPFAFDSPIESPSLTELRPPSLLALLGGALGAAAAAGAARRWCDVRIIAARRPARAMRFDALYSEEVAPVG